MIEFLIIFLAYPAGLIIRKIAKEDYDSFLQIFSKILLIVFTLYYLPGTYKLFTILIAVFLIKFKSENLNFLIPLVTNSYYLIPYMLILGLKNSEWKITSLYLITSVIYYIYI
jgi:hypothetical protein